MAGMVGLQTSHRYGNATMLESDFVLGIGNRWANRHTGSIETYTKGRTFVHVDIEPTQIGRVFIPISASCRTQRPRLSCSWRWRQDGARQAGSASGRPGRRRVMIASARCLRAKRFRRRADQAAARVSRDEPGVRARHLLCQRDRTVADRRRAISRRLSSAQLDQCRAGGAFGMDASRRARRARGRPGPRDRGVVRRLRFSFLIEELAVGAQFKLPYIHVVVNNSYLGLIRQAQARLRHGLSGALSFENINAPELGAYGVDHVAVAEGLGCKAIRVTDPNPGARGFYDGARMDGALQRAGRGRVHPGTRHKSRWAPRSTTIIEFEDVL